MPKKYTIQVKVVQYLYDDPKHNHYSVELNCPNSTVVFQSFKTHKAALKFTERFEFQKAKKSKKAVKVTDFRGTESLEELIAKQAA